MSDDKLDVTVLLFCYNEEESLPKVIGDIHAAFKGAQYSYEVLLVDDGSTDKSASIAQGLDCRVIQHVTRRGAGAAFKTGVLSSKAPIIVMLDADGTYTAADIPKMLGYFPEFDQVNGARTSEKGDLRLLRAPAKWLVRMFVSLLAGKKIPDLQTGLKAFKKDMMLSYLWIIPDKFSHCPLITLAFLCNGHPVKYIPTEYHHRTGGRSKFHPIKDTAYVLMQVCRFFMYFDPLRIFFPVVLFAIVSISCLGVVIYSNTFFSSFHFDDKFYIISNPFISNIQALLNNWKFYPCRFITFLSLALNYHFSGLHVFGYHLFNLAVHLGTACLVWWLTLLTFSTPVMKKDEITRNANLIALLAGLVFVSHPIQTEAVTYIWQRTASMAALFYLASLCLYIKSRLLVLKSDTHSSSSPKSLKGIVYYILSLIIAVVAMFTKENTVTLPLMVLLYEISFFGPWQKLNWKRLLPFLLTIFIIPLTILLTKAQQFQAIQRFIEGPGGTSSLQYLLTQFRVIVTYIRLIFLPFNQNLDYDYSISKSIFEWPVLMSFLFLTAILLFAKHIFSNYRLVSFSILWFFLTLLPESSFFPLKNIIFEHRLYLPIVGYSIFLVSSVFYLLQKSPVRIAFIILMGIITANSVLTYQRNKVWTDEFTLWNDVVQKSPYKARPYNNRGVLYGKQGNLTQALADYNKAIAIDSNYAEAYYNRGNAYKRQGNIIKALADYSKAIEIVPNYLKAYYNRGEIYRRQGKLGQALTDYNKAIEINPDIGDLYYSRAITYYQLGDYDNAWVSLHQATELGTSIDPNFIVGLIKASGRGS